MKSKTLLTLAMLCFTLTSLAVAQQTDDREAVHQAVLDYVEGIYEVQPDRIERSVSRELAKVGYWREKDGGTYSESRMSFEQLVEVAKNWNKKGRVDPKTALKEVVIYEIVDQTATVKLRAHWGIDYMHLAKKEGKWLIMNVLWQSPPPQDVK
ncbi:nuclear transport factor 2 family protein [candidate division KSB1 bacterium]|nr:nuclear transport factor 2 family protein [candidate division KSB1 bacterium]